MKNKFKAILAILSTAAMLISCSQMDESEYGEFKSDFFQWAKEDVLSNSGVASKFDDHSDNKKKEERVSLFSRNHIAAKGWFDKWDAKYIDDYYHLIIDFNDRQVEDIYGNKFDSAATIYTYSTSNWGTRGVYYVYDTEDYSKLEGGIALLDKAKSFTGYAMVCIDARRESDGEWDVVHEQRLSTLMKPSDFSVDLSGYDMVRVRFVTTDSSYEYIKGYDSTIGVILYDFILS